MATTSSDFIQARLLIDGILEELGIDAYLFEIEPHDGQWELKVECAVEEGWGSYHVTLDDAQVQAGFNGDAARNELKQCCSESLKACRFNSETDKPG